MAAGARQRTAVYMPILKWKQGELRALELVGSATRPFIVPLVDIVEDSIDVDLEQTMSPPFHRSASRLAKAWIGAQVFVDADELDFGPGGPQPVTDLFAALRAAGVLAMPVARIGCSTAYTAAVATIIQTDRRGCAIRLSVDDVIAPTLPASIMGAVLALGIAHNAIDVVVDFGAIDPTGATTVYLAAAAVLPTLPNLAAWRSVVFAASSFPQDLSAAGVGVSTIPRAEWAIYQNLLATMPGGRAVSFGDYAIAHPLYRPIGFPGSAAIRYTITNDWLIHRGRSVNGPVHGGYGQFQALSAQLVTHTACCGSGHCWGDQFIAACSQGGQLGNNTTWRAVGTNHHVTFVAQQCASYRAPASGLAPPPVGP